MVHAWSPDAATSISQEARWDKNRDVLTSTVRQLEFIKVLLTRVPHASNLVTLYCIIILLLYYYSIIILFLYYLITYHIRTWRPPWMHPNPILRNALMIRLSGSMDSRLLFVFVIRAKLITFGAFPRLFSKSSSFCRLGFVRSKISELFFKNHLVLWFGARLLIMIW